MDGDQELAGAPDKVSVGALTPGETFVVHNTTFERTDEEMPDVQSAVRKTKRVVWRMTICCWSATVWAVGEHIT